MPSFPRNQFADLEEMMCKVKKKSCRGAQTKQQQKKKSLQARSWGVNVSFNRLHPANFTRPLALLVVFFFLNRRRCLPVVPFYQPFYCEPESSLRLYCDVKSLTNYPPPPPGS